MVEEEVWVTTIGWNVANVQGVTATIPANESVGVSWENRGDNARVSWIGFQKKQMGYSVLVTRDGLSTHACRISK